MSDCKHEVFYCNCEVTRLFKKEDPETITGYTTDITINCTQCGQAFEFIGVPGGYSPLQPMVSADGLELRAPIRPSLLPIEKVEGRTYN